MSSSPERSPAPSPVHAPDDGALPSYDAGSDVRDDPWYGRRGRMSPQRLADFTELYVRYGLSGADPLAAWRPATLEIGFGAGESVVDLATADPITRVLAVDTFGPGVLALMRGLEAAAIENVRVARANVLGLLPELPAGQLTLVRIFFPDPWPKRRHAGRRLLQPDVATRLVELLGSGGVLHYATDSTSYAQDVRALLHGFDELTPVAPPVRASTRYEAHALRAGRPVRDLAWRKRA
ncbi:MAG: tRNA (guanosine(46)-N7)-methyltransferase TrmB [Actinomycetota bacterium]|nr:tRNA (guanosine(46)-N7)-methyltransferase TrmB [Actinomycetota bacterium]